MAACTYRPTASHPPRSNVRLAIHTHHHRFRSHTLYGPDDSDRYAAEPHPVHRQRHAHVPCTTRTRALYHTHTCPVPHAHLPCTPCPVPHAHMPRATCTRALYHMHTCPVPHAHMPCTACTHAPCHMHTCPVPHAHACSHALLPLRTGALPFQPPGGSLGPTSSFGRPSAATPCWSSYLHTVHRGATHHTTWPPGSSSSGGACDHVLLAGYAGRSCRFVAGVLEC